MVSYITQSLYYDLFSFHARCEPKFFHLVRHIANFPETKEHTKAGRFTAASYTTLRNWFTCNTTRRVDLTGVHGRISIQDPGHLSFPCSIIGGGYIRTGANEIFLDQFGSITLGDLFQLIRRIFFRVDLDAAFPSAEGNVHD